MSSAQNGCGAYICQVSQFNLQVGLSRLGLRSHGHGNNLGVHNGVVPASDRNWQTWANQNPGIQPVLEDLWEAGISSFSLLANQISVLQLVLNSNPNKTYSITAGLQKLPIICQSRYTGCLPAMLFKTSKQRRKKENENQRLAWTERDVSLYPTLLRSGILVLFEKLPLTIE